MRIREAIQKRTMELAEEKHLPEHMLIYQSGIPASTFKSIMGGQSKNPGIVTIKRIAEGLGVTTREFYDSEIFDSLEPED